MRPDHYLLKALRRLYLCVPHSADWNKDVIRDPEEASRSIIETLTSEKPCMICRYGSTELYNVANYLSIADSRHSALRFVTDKQMEWWRNELNVRQLRNNAGFFPTDESSMRRFDRLMLEDTKQVDILGSWIRFEKFISGYIPETAKRVSLKYLEPFWSKVPWTVALEGKRVLVVHPFASLIESQYADKRSVLFPGREILPDFELITIRSVQSIGGKNDDFRDWFEALEYMKKQIDAIDYDVCIIGCGAYGFPLAAHVKRSGKKAFHLGGATQLLFGIRGRRWEDPMYGVRDRGFRVGEYSSMMNENWARPDDSMKPSVFAEVENGCYW